MRRLAKSCQLVRSQGIVTKKHPKECKRHQKGFCKFGNDCAYSDQKTRNNNMEIHVKVEMLEKMVHEMAENIVELESKVKKN